MWVRSPQSPVSLSLTTFYMPDIFVHTLSCHVRDFSHHTSLWSQDHKDGSLVADAFVWYFFVKARSGVPLLLLQWVHCLAQNLLSSCSKLSAFLSEDVVLSESSSGVMTQWQGHRSFKWWGIPSTKINFGHLTSAEFRLCSTFSDLVRAVLGTWGCCHMFSPFYPNFVSIDLVGRHSGRWYVVSGCDFIPVDSLLYGTAHPGCNLFPHAVTLLCYSIPGWGTCAMEL